jgi:16S rRNA (uracil1498-N3)-methyltransferase
MAVGDTITVSDGQGTDYECSLLKIRDEECEASILSASESCAEPPCEITLYMAYPKGDKLETVVQKAVELGASHIVPFVSERCIKRPSEDRQDKQMSRLTRIAHEAAKQCGRARLPDVSTALPFAEMLEKQKNHEITLFCYEGRGTVKLSSAITRERIPQTLGIIVGSEGGFSESEAEKCVEAGAVAVNLGPRILRCETAPEYCLSAISFVYEM